MSKSMAKSEPSSSAREVATTIATSTSKHAINLLDDATKEVVDMYDKNKSTLGDSASFKFETDFNRLELATVELKEKYIQDCLNVSWAGLPCRLSHEKYAWAIARAYRRGVDDLKTWLELAIMGAKKGRLQAALETRDQREDRATAPPIDASVV
ncbi:hypothetical protein ARMSODRAFT_1011500 [Armillaria solidipes]|uniref:Uncharacterized protein n=1 Tax=Armillaria solidipes TaxID=1076256 RepID=A0A2H3C4K2_9AGAR|nr:hypothetical protein ARMSODRAFT_1011500 [Armillaria solidipes]